jgi:hypothetical protein
VGKYKRAAEKAEEELARYKKIQQLKEANTKAENAKDLEKQKRIYVEKRLNVALEKAARERNARVIGERKQRYDADIQILSG